MSKMKLMAFFFLLLVIGLPITSQAQVNIWRLTIMDTTYSMETPHGTYATRLDAAKASAKLAMTDYSDSTSIVVHDALWKLSGAASGEVEPFTTNTETVTSYYEPDDTRLAIELTDTPLADTLCKAMKILEGAGVEGEINTKMLFFFTDGKENSSGIYWPEEEIVCSTGIHDYPDNDKLFTVDANQAFAYADGEETGRINTTERNENNWAPFDSLIQAAGRAYKNSVSGQLQDWSAGVLPGSWEWRMYYRVARGENGIPETAVNYPWPPSNEEQPTDIVANIFEFFDDELSGSLMMKMVIADIDGKSNTQFAPIAKSVATTSDAYTYPTYSKLEIEQSLFSGLAELTGGNFYPAPSSAPIPIFGDMNGDNVVDETDLRIVLTWFGRPVDSYNPQSGKSDLTPDGFINNLDITVIRSAWTDGTKPAPILGDIDYNWVVDQADLAQVMQWYGQSVDPGAQHSYHADMNADGFIDELDVAIVEDAMNNPLPTCTDSVLNGNETDVDCGGVCTPCVEGQTCVANSDCQSDNCLSGVCDVPVGFDVVASISITNDWGAGYCANINVTNYNAASTTAWSVLLDASAATIDNSWSANFSGTSGDVSVSPVGWNAVVAGGQTISSPGFCAMRNGGDVEVIDANGTY